MLSRNMKESLKSLFVISLFFYTLFFLILFFNFLDSHHALSLLLNEYNGNKMPFGQITKKMYENNTRKK